MYVLRYISTMKILLLDTFEIVKASPWQFVIHSNSKDNFKIKIYMDLYAFVCLAP